MIFTVSVHGNEPVVIEADNIELAAMNAAPNECTLYTVAVRDETGMASLFEVFVSRDGSRSCERLEGMDAEDALNELEVESVEELLT